MSYRCVDSFRAAGSGWKKGVLRSRLKLSATGQRQGNGLWDYRKLSFLFDQVHEYKFFKKDSAGWN
jgi:hypothetical protein